MWPRWSSSQFSALFLILSLSVTNVIGHGYISNPPSRAALCKQGKAKDCGAIQYEPQSVESRKGMPFKVSGDGKLCSANVDRFAELDKQGAKAWPHTNSSFDSFTWTILANHATTDFSYFITKPNWDSSKSSGLVAGDLDDSPFLEVPMNGKPPGSSVTHEIQNLPDRQGYHIVYVVWTIADTGNAFYQCVDVDFDGQSSSPSSSVTSSNSNAALPKSEGNASTPKADSASSSSTVIGSSSSPKPKTKGRCKSRRGNYKRTEYKRSAIAHGRTFKNLD